MKSRARYLVCVAALSAATSFAQTSIEHSGLAYFVPGKRITVDARVTDPKGIKVVRTYFRAGAQADYTYVPMQYSTGNRYVATIPAPSDATPSIEYVMLAQNNDGAVSKTLAYRMEARKSAQTPSWQSSPGRGEVKVFTEAATKPATVAGFTDSITLDVAESGARLGAVAGLYSASAGGTAGGTAAASSSSSAATTATTTATTGGTTAAGTAATVGGLSTTAIIAGVAVAGVAAAAAGSGSGSGGGGSSSPSGTGNPFASTTWSGTSVGTSSATCSGFGVSSSSTCTATQAWTVTIDPAGNATLNVAPGTDVCTNSATGNTTAPVSGFTGTFAVSSNGSASFAAPGGSSGGLTETCTPVTLTFSNSPRRVTGGNTCTESGSPTPGITCSGNGTSTLTGS